MFKQIILLSSLLFFSLIGLGQSSIVSSGHSVSVTGGSISYSVGQIDYKSTSGSSGEVNEGVQQPLEIYTVEIKEKESASDLYKIYPNPVTSSFQLQIEDFSYTDFIATLYTQEGKIIFKKTVYNGSQTLSIEDLPKGIYLLNIQKEDSIIKMFKIIKS